jgi:hypothetical protein
MRCPTLLQAAVAVAIVASQARAVSSQSQASARGPAVTRFECSHCTATDQLQLEASSCGLLLSRAADHRHVAASKPCFIAKLGHREIQVGTLPGDGMAGAGGGQRRTLDTSHQVEDSVKISL